MKRKLTKMLAYLLVSLFILPGYLIASVLTTTPQPVKAATQVGGGGNIVGGILNDVGLNPITIYSAEAGDIDSSGVTIEISQNTTSKLEFDTVMPIMVVPSANLDLGSGNGVPIIITALSNKITIPVITASSAVDDGIVVIGVKVGATLAGYESTYTGTENLIVKTAGGTVVGSPILVDTQCPDFSNITSNPKYAKTGNVDLSFSTSEPLLGNPDVMINGNVASFVSLVGQNYQYQYAVTVADTEGPATIQIFGADVNFNIDLAGVTDTSALFIDMTKPSVPVNAVATASGKNIQVSWDASNDGVGSGIAGYNLFRSDNAFATPINPSLIIGANYIDTPGLNDDYSYKVEAVDKAGNISAKSVASNNVDFMGALPQAPANVITSVSGHTLTISWDAVGGGVTGYIVTINGVSRDAENVTTYATNLDYGTYTVLVTSYYSADSFGINDSNGLSDTKNAAITAGLEKSVTLASAVKTASVSQVGVAPESVEAAETPAVTTEPETTTDEGLVTEEEGKIKGEEESTETTDENINWTPWIILFVLIILAGAATGGYFYWFSGEEEAETKIKTRPEVEKKEIIKPKTKDSSSKKPRRW
jgi:hypothetical protein